MFQPEVELTAVIDTCVSQSGSVLLSPEYVNVESVVWSDGTQTADLSVNSSGVYSVVASNQCGTDSAISVVTINYYPELVLPTLIDTCFVVGVGFPITAYGNTGVYSWSSGSTTSSEWIYDIGYYSCTLTNSCGSITETVLVELVNAVELYIPDDSLEFCTYSIEVSELNIETNYDLSIENTNGDLITGAITETGWYRVIGSNICGYEEDSVYVNLGRDFSDVYLPNTFTPNEDIINDVYTYGGVDISIKEVQIFNRWGEVVYEEIGSFSGWDGKYKGLNCSQGVYIVRLVYADCTELPTEIHGHVTLIR